MARDPALLLPKGSELTHGREAGDNVSKSIMPGHRDRSRELHLRAEAVCIARDSDLKNDDDKKPRIAERPARS